MTGLRIFDMAVLSTVELQGELEGKFSSPNIQTIAWFLQVFDLIIYLFVRVFYILQHYPLTHTQRGIHYIFEWSCFCWIIIEAEDWSIWCKYGVPSLWPKLEKGTLWTQQRGTTSVIMGDDIYETKRRERPSFLCRAIIFSYKQK